MTGFNVANLVFFVKPFFTLDEVWAIFELNIKAKKDLCDVIQWL